MSDDFDLDPTILPSAERRKAEKKRAVEHRRAQLSVLAPLRGPFKALRTVATIYKACAIFTALAVLLLGLVDIADGNIKLGLTVWIGAPVTFLTLYAAGEVILVFLSIEESVRKLREHSQADREASGG